MDAITVECALTALAVWEELLNRFSEQTDPDLVDFWEQIGSAEMRVHTLTIAKWVDDVYAAMPEESIDGVAFDWEFIPFALDLVEWENSKPEKVKLLPIKKAVMFVAESLELGK